MKRPSDIPERIWHISLGMELERDPGEAAEPFIMRVLTRLREIEVQQGAQPSTRQHCFIVKHDGKPHYEVDYYLSEDGNLCKEEWTVTPGNKSDDVSYTVETPDGIGSDTVELEAP